VAALAEPPTPPLNPVPTLRVQIDALFATVGEDELCMEHVDQLQYTCKVCGEQARATVAKPTVRLLIRLGRNLGCTLFTSQVIKESMRLYPPAPYTARTLTKEMVVGG
jgi:cytochrome P450